MALPYWDGADGDEWGRLERRYGGGGDDEDDDEDDDDDRAGTTHHMPLEVGSVTVHNGWTLHCADAAAAGDDRYALSITYVDGRAELREDVLAETTTAARDDKELLHML
jgi:ectoine hydroxylase-related dioxygenase (phytanoyl-CoA dioxygenase family)